MFHTIFVAVLVSAPPGEGQALPPPPEEFRILTQPELLAEVRKDLRDAAALRDRVTRRVAELDAILERRKARQDEHDAEMRELQTRSRFCRSARWICWDIESAIRSVNSLRHRDDFHHLGLKVVQEVRLDNLERFSKKLEDCAFQLANRNLNKNDLAELQGARTAYRTLIDFEAASFPPSIVPPPRSLTERLRGYDNMTRGLKQQMVTLLDRTGKN